MNSKAKGLTVEQTFCSILFSQDTVTLKVWTYTIMNFRKWGTYRTV